MNPVDDIKIGDILSDAQKALKGNWGTIIGAYVIYLLISIFSGVIPVIPFVIEGPLSIGLSTITLNLIRRKELSINMLFDGFNNFSSALGLFILTGIIVFIGFVLFIIPGIILLLGFSQVFYVLTDNPQMPVVDVMKKSFEMMKGYKTKYFLMVLVFGLILVACIFTLGLGLIWAIPVMVIAQAKFYTLINANETDGLAIEDNLIA